MSSNAFPQIESQLNEAEDMRSHARMERNAELRAKLDSTPVADELVRIASGRLGEQLAKNLDEEIYLAICHCTGCPAEIGFAIDEVRHRGGFVTRPGGVMIFVMDGQPMLEIQPLSSAMDGNVITVTRNIKRLYGTEEKTNPQERAAS